MIDISSLLDTIKTAVYGKDMRGAIHDSLEQLSLNSMKESEINQKLGEKADKEETEEELFGIKNDLSIITDLTYDDKGKILTVSDGTESNYESIAGFLFVNIGSTNTTYRLVANYQGTGLEITENSLAGCRLTADLSLQDGGDFPVDTLVLSNEMRDSYQTVLVIQKPEGKPATQQGDSFSNLTVYTPAYQAAPVWKGLENEYGGFCAGSGAQANAGGAIGDSAQAGLGGAVGWAADAQSGGAIGYDAHASSGGAAGNFAETSSGGSVGDGAVSTTGGAVGENTQAGSGGAVGKNAVVGSDGGAVGFNAMAESGGAVGYETQAGSGGAVGEGAYAGGGGAVGFNARTENGFAGGLNAKTISGGEAIDAIQLGTGTNSIPNTFQVYNYPLLDANGVIPVERIPELSDKADKCAGTYIVNTQEDWNTLVADSAWLGARHVVICTDIALSGKVVIPPTVMGLEAVGGAKISYTVSDAPYNETFSFGYAALPDEKSGAYLKGIRLEIELNPSQQSSDDAYGFYQCRNLYGCSCILDFTQSAFGDTHVSAFYGCSQLVNCTGEAYAYPAAGITRCFDSCSFLSGCIAFWNGGYHPESVWLFRDCSHIVCSGLVNNNQTTFTSNMSLWSDCTKVDTDSCDDEPEKA